MSVKKVLSFGKGEASSSSVKRDPSSKRRRFGRCFSYTQEINMEPPAPTSLKDMDSFKFRSDIKKWAHAVAALACQVSGRFGSGRRQD